MAETVAQLQLCRLSLALTMLEKREQLAPTVYLMYGHLVQEKYTHRGVTRTSRRLCHVTTPGPHDGRLFAPTVGHWGLQRVHGVDTECDPERDAAPI